MVGLPLFSVTTPVLLDVMAGFSAACLALLLIGPGRFSLGAGMAPEALAAILAMGDDSQPLSEDALSEGDGASASLAPAPITLDLRG